MKNQNLSCFLLNFPQIEYNVIALQSHSTHMYHLQLSNSQKKMKPSHPLNSFPSKFKKHNTQEIIFHFKSNTWYASKTVEKETTP